MKISSFFESKYGTRNKNIEPEESSSLPIRVLVGYLQDVSESVALNYAQDLANKYFESVTLAYFKVFKFRNGFVYEAHEGGSGFSYLFDILGDISNKKFITEDTSFEYYIKTATKAVKISVTEDKFNVLYLTDSRSKEVSTTIEVSNSKLNPAFDKREGLKFAGNLIFGTGLIAFFVCLMIGRYQPVEQPDAPRIASVSIENLPINKWDAIINEMKPGTKLVKVEFANKKWKNLEFKPIVEPAPEVPSASAITDTKEVKEYKTNGHPDNNPSPSGASINKGSKSEGSKATPHKLSLKELIENSNKKGAQ